MVARWLNSLFKWTAKRFKKSRSSVSPQVIKRYYGSECAILRLERSTRGAIATYRIIPRVGNWDYLLTLDSIALVEAEMVGRINGANFVLRSHDDLFVPGRSHRFAVWRVYRNGVCACIGCWDCNLEGGYPQRSLAPTRIFSGAALHTLKIQATLTLSWQQQVEGTDWVGLLERYAQGYLRREHSCMAVRRI